MESYAIRIDPEKENAKKHRCWLAVFGIPFISWQMGTTLGAVSALGPEAGAVSLHETLLDKARLFMFRVG